MDVLGRPPPVAFSLTYEFLAPSYSIDDLLFDIRKADLLHLQKLLLDLPKLPIALHLIFRGGRIRDADNTAPEDSLRQVLHELDGRGLLYIEKGV